MPKSTMLAKKLARLREEADQSLQDVANAVGVSRAHLWEVETGKSKNPSLDLVRKLADHFTVSVAWLIGTSWTLRMRRLPPSTGHFSHYRRKISSIFKLLSNPCAKPRLDFCA